MALVKPGHWGNVWPRGMPRIDLGNSITRQMLRAYVVGYNNRTPIELLTGAQGWTVNSEVGLRVRTEFNGSQALYAGNYTLGFRSSENNYRNDIDNKFSACVLFQQGRETGSAAATNAIFGNASGGGAYTYNWAIESLYIGNGVHRLRAVVRSGGVVTATSQQSQGDGLYLLNIVCDGEFLHLYRNGSVLSSVAFSGAINQNNLTTSFLGSQATGTPGITGYFYWAGIWNRALDQEEIRWLNNNRWGLFAAAGSPVFYSLPSQGVSTPVLSNPTVFNITATSANPRVTVTI